MSRSYRKPWIKDKPRRIKNTELYWRPIRRVLKQFLKLNYLDPDINFPYPKSIINDYNYCDYRFEIYVNKEKTNMIGIIDGWTKENVKKYSRK